MSSLQHRNLSTLQIGCDSVFTYVNSGPGASQEKRTDSIDRLFWWDGIFQKGAKFQIYSMQQKRTCRCLISQSRYSTQLRVSPESNNLLCTSAQY